MTVDIGSAEPAPMSGGARAGAKRRKRVVTFVLLAAAVRTALDRRTLVGAIVLAIGLAAVKGAAQERGMPALEWYKAQAHKARKRIESHHSALRRGTVVVRG
jgi:hypothetical protein